MIINVNLIYCSRIQYYYLPSQRIMKKSHKIEDVLKPEYIQFLPKLFKAVLKEYPTLTMIPINPQINPSDQSINQDSQWSLCIDKNKFLQSVFYLKLNKNPYANLKVTQYSQNQSGQHSQIKSFFNLNNLISQISMILQVVIQFLIQSYRYTCSHFGMMETNVDMSAINLGNVKLMKNIWKYWDDDECLRWVVEEDKKIRRKINRLEFQESSKKINLSSIQKSLMKRRYHSQQNVYRTDLKQTLKVTKRPRLRSQEEWSKRVSCKQNLNALKPKSRSTKNKKTLKLDRIYKENSQLPIIHKFQSLDTHNDPHVRKSKSKSQLFPVFPVIKQPCLETQKKVKKLRINISNEDREQRTSDQENGKANDQNNSYAIKSKQKNLNQHEIKMIEKTFEQLPFLVSRKNELVRQMAQIYGFNRQAHQHIRKKMKNKYGLSVFCSLRSQFGETVKLIDKKYKLNHLITDIIVGLTSSLEQITHAIIILINKTPLSFQNHGNVQGCELCLQVLLNRLSTTISLNLKTLGIVIKQQYEREMFSNKQNTKKEKKIINYKYSRKLTLDDKIRGSITEQTTPNQAYREYQQNQIFTKFMPYFYFLSVKLREIINKLVIHLETSVIFIVNLNDINTLGPDCDSYLQKNRQIFNFLIQKIAVIPISAFHLSEIERQKIQSTLESLQDRLIEAKSSWSAHLSAKYTLKSIKTKLDPSQIQNQSLLKRKRTLDLVIQNSLSEEIADYENQIDSVISKKTCISVQLSARGIKKTYILDTNLAKNKLIKNIEAQLCKKLSQGIKKMKQIGGKWQRQMARTERMLAHEIDEEKEGIKDKITQYYRQFSKLFKICFFDQQRLYKIDNCDSTQSPSLEKTHHSISASQNKLQSMKAIDILQTQPNFNDENNDFFVRYLFFLYHMSKRTFQKLEQIVQISKVHNDRIKIFTKSLQSQEFASKSEFLRMTTKQLAISKEIKCKSDFLKKQEELRTLQKQYKAYLGEKKLLQEEMLKHEMTIWEDDEAFVNDLSISLKIIDFLFSEPYRRINNQTLDILTPKTFKNFCLYYQKLSKSLKNHKFAHFLSEFNYSEQEQKMIEMCLYKGYVQEQQNMLGSLEINIKLNETHMKISDVVKIMKSCPEIYEKVRKIFNKRKGKRYTKELQKIIQVQVTLCELSGYGLWVISNFDDIKTEIATKIEEDRWNHKIKVLNECQLQAYTILQGLTDNLVNHIRIKQQLSERELKDADGYSFSSCLEQYIQKFSSFVQIVTQHKNLYLPHFKQDEISLWQEIKALDDQINSIDMKTRLYMNLSQATPRVLFLPFPELMKFIKCSSIKQLKYVILSIFPEVKEVETDENRVTGLFIQSRGLRKDKLFIRNYQPERNKVEDIKNIEARVIESVKSMINNSNGRIGQMKIISLFLYFTEQVETLMLINCSLDSLCNQLQQKIQEITLDLRYDINNHKQQEIAQLNAFVHYIRDKLGPYPSLQSYEWQSTIRYYQKGLQIFLYKFAKNFSFGFQPKSTQVIYKMNIQLDIREVYESQDGIKSNHELVSYLIGTPFFRIYQTKRSFLTSYKNIMEVIKFLQSNLYFLAIHQHPSPQSPTRQLENELVNQCVRYYSLINKKMTNHPLQKQKTLLKQQKTPIIFHYENLRQRSKHYSECSNHDFTCLNNSSAFCLRIHLLVHTHLDKLPNGCKNQLIWKFMQLKNFTLKQGIGLTENLYKAFEKITWYLESMSEQVIQNAGNIRFERVRKIVDILVSECSFLEFQETFQNIQEIFMKPNMNQEKHLFPRQQLLLKSLKNTEEVILTHPTQTIIVYGTATTCKSTLITTLTTKFDNLKIYESPVLSEYLIGQEEAEGPLKCQIFEYGDISTVSPHIITNAYLVYMTEISGQQLLQEQKKEVFEKTIEKGLIDKLINLDKVAKKQLISQMINETWEWLLMSYGAYKQITSHKLHKKNQLCFQIHEILPVIVQILELLLSQERQLDCNQICFDAIDQCETDNFERCVKQINNKIGRIKSLIQIVIVQYFAFTLDDKQYRNIFYEKIMCGKSETNQVDYSKQTYTPNGSILQIGSNNKQSKGRQIKKLSLDEPQVNKKLLVIDSEVNIMKKYIDMEISIMVWSDSHHVQEQAIQQLRAYKTIKSIQYCFRVKANDIQTLFQKIQQSNQITKHKVTISRNLITRTCFSIAGESRKIFDGFDQCLKSLIVFVDDVHLGKSQNLGFIKTLVETNGPTYKETFILFGNRGQQSQMEKRYKRNCAQFYLPLLKLETIFKARIKALGQEKVTFLDSVLNQFKEIDPNLKKDLLIETILTLPSLMYYKYIYIMVSKLSLNGGRYFAGIPQHRFMPSRVFSSFQQVGALKEKFYKILGRQIYLLVNQRQILYEPESSISKQNILKVINKLSKQEQIASRIILPSVPLAVSQGSYIVYGDPFKLLPVFVSVITNHKVLYLTHNYMSQLTQVITQLMFNSELNVICVVPSFLSVYEPFIKFIKLIHENDEIIFGSESGSYEAEKLWELLWQATKRKQYVENLSSQQLKVKSLMESIFRKKISYYFYMENQSLSPIQSKENQVSLISQFMKDRDSNMKSAIKKLTVLNLQMDAKTLIEASKQMVENQLKINTKALNEINDMSERKIQIEKLKNAASSLASIIEYLLKNEERLLGSQKRILNIKQLPKYIRLILKEIKSQLLNQKIKFPAVYNKQRDFSNSSVLEKIQIFFQSALNHRKLIKQAYKLKQFYKNCYSNLMTIFNSIESKRASQQKPFDTQMKNRKFNSIVQKGLYKSSEFVKTKKQFIENFHSKQSLTIENIATLLSDQHANLIADVTNLIKSANLGSSIRIFKPQFLTWVEFDSKTSLDDLKNMLTLADRLEKLELDEKLKAFFNITELVTSIRYIYQVSHYFLKQQNSKLSLLERYPDLEAAHLQTFWRQLFEMQLLYAQYIQIIDKLQQIKFILTLIQLKSQELSNMLSGIINFLKFLLEFDNYQIVYFGINANEKVIDLNDQFFSQNMECFVNFRVVKKEKDILAHSMYDMLFTHILSQMPHNHAASQNIKGILGIQKPITDLSTLRKQSFMSSRQKSIHHILFGQYYQFEKQSKYAKQKKNRIFERKPRHILRKMGNSMLEVNDSNIIGIHSRNTLIQPGQFSEEFKNTDPKLLRKQTQQHESIEQELTNFKAPTIIYDISGSISQFLLKFRQDYNYQVYYLKEHQFNCPISEQSYNYCQILLENPILHQINHIPTFYIFYMSPKCNAQSKHQQIQFISIIIKFFNTKDQSLHDHLLIIVPQPSMLQSTKDMLELINPHNSIKAWSIIQTQNDLLNANNSKEDNKNEQCLSLFNDYSTVSSQIMNSLSDFIEQLQANYPSVTLSFSNSRDLSIQLDTCNTLIKRNLQITNVLMNQCGDVFDHELIEKCPHIFSTLLKLIENQQVPLQFIKQIKPEQYLQLTKLQPMRIEEEILSYFMVKPTYYQSIQTNKEESIRLVYYKQLVEMIISPLFKQKQDAIFSVVTYNREVPKELLELLQSSAKPKPGTFIRIIMMDKICQYLDEYGKSMQEDEQNRIFGLYYKIIIDQLSSKLSSQSSTISLRNRASQKHHDKYVFVVKKQNLKYFKHVFHMVRVIALSC